MNKLFDNDKVNKRLRELRESKGWSQSEMGEKLNDILKGTMNLDGENGKQTVSQLERNRKITIEIAFAYANIFDKSLDFILGWSDDWQPEYRAIKDLTGLNDESIEILKKCYTDWPNNSITRTINLLLKDRNTLFSIAQYLFYTMNNSVVPIELKYDLAKDESTWTDDLSGYYVDSQTSLEAFDIDRLKTIFLFEVQTNLQNILKNQSKE